MFADQLDYMVGVDPHRDTHALAIVEVANGAVIVEATVLANNDGYAEALRLVEEHAPGRRVFAIEGTGSYGLGHVVGPPRHRRVRPRGSTRPRSSRRSRCRS
ncbi:MAG: hypothetical protein H0W90_07115 [Actinobacteria bacterium]|nr:hypothetical protein [Actinomycetota bacterium]